MQQTEVFGFRRFMLQFILIFNVYEASGCLVPPRTITVSRSGGQGTSRTIQAAIDSVPPNNNRWVRIVIPAGLYRERVGIPADKPCIYLKGAGSNSTIIDWNDASQTNTSATLTVSASDFLAKDVAIKNSYNLLPRPQNEIISAAKKPAVAVELVGDRAAFFFCTFQGVQDTVFDENGRHYFHKCTIQGEIDFIFGNGQSLYQQCVIEYVPGPEGYIGFITAQGRKTIHQTSGFVFDRCIITGKGQVYLGRAYGVFSRVIIANSTLNDVVYPIGWSAWDSKGHEERLTYVEEGNRGAGADKSKRVPWLKHMGPAELNQFLSTKYIDTEGWLSKLPR
ncbi:hypothetical protein L6164_029452 [Bauhinia variegata]|uniref:Uncharacterized protein n=1 Tax=Bauhinia variegata TaxID=167791 RepID=A0ACB9L9Q0_BAUVA|nr:hypothetical protein L6164_029452 [Bauhinia variegata]